MSSLGDAIRQARLKKNMTQEELANALQTTKSAISKYELGKREPSLAVIAKIAITLGVRIEDIMGLEAFDSPEEFHREWERRTSQSEGPEITIIHKVSGQIQIIDHQKEHLVATYELLDPDDQGQLVKYGDLLAGQAKYQEDNEIQKRNLE